MFLQKHNLIKTNILVYFVLFPRNMGIKATMEKGILNFKCFILQCICNWIMLVFLRFLYWWHSITMGFAGRYFLLISPYYTPFNLLKNVHGVALTKAVFYSEPGKLWAILVWASIRFLQPLPGKVNLPGWERILFMITPAGLYCTMCDLTGMVSVSSMPVYL